MELVRELQCLPIPYFQFRLLVDAHVVDQHALRKESGGARASRPSRRPPPGGDQKERFIEDPILSRVQVSACAAHAEVMVDIKEVRVRLDSEDPASLALLSLGLVDCFV